MRIEKFNLESIISREERHYCAYLFKWLLQNKGNVERFLPLTVGFDKMPELYYEYTLVREYLFSKKDDDDYKEVKARYDQLLGAEIKAKGKREKWDVTKKKIDLGIHAYVNGKLTIYLVEAKFEEPFDEDQVRMTYNYGEILKEIANSEIDYHVILLGRKYYVDAWMDKKKDWIENDKFYVTWEDLVHLIVDEQVKKEIKRGLEFQEKSHPRTKKFIGWLQNNAN